MVNLHEPQHTFMSPEINSPACPRRVCRLVGAILYPVAGRMTRCSEPARHTTHFSPNIKTERSQEEEKEEQTFLCDNYQKLWIPVQESQRLAQISWINFMPVLGSSHYTLIQIR